MERRRILGAIGTLGIPGLAQAGRLYGMPASVSGSVVGSGSAPMRLALETASVPPDVIQEVSVLGTLWERVLGTPEERKKFQRDPRGYMEANGIPNSSLTAQDQEVKVLAAICDEDLLAASVRGDYKAFLGQLSALGLVRPGPPSALKKRVLEVLKRNLGAVRAEVASLAATPGSNPQLQMFLESKEVQYLYSQLIPSIEQVAVAAVPVAIAAIVVTYVSVAVGVTVAILAGVYISIAVSMGVVASQGCMDNTLKGPLFAGPVSGPLTPKHGQTVREREIERAFVERALLGKRMLALDPDRLAEAQRTARVARLIKQDAFVLEANRQLVRDEVDAFVAAAEELELLTIPPHARATVMQAMHQLSLRAAGLE